MNLFSHIPPGFRFHPTEEELVDYYLRKKITSRRIDIDVIQDIDLYKIEPWDLPEVCKMNAEEQNEWYFFSHKDKKYPSGTRTNRATTAGFWKATGRDKPIYSKEENLIGMRKTLVFYKGRAPNGQKLDWIMHEYRLETNEDGPPDQDEGWVVCRVFKKKVASTQIHNGHGCSPSSYQWFEENNPFTPQQCLQTAHNHSHHYMNFKPELHQQLPQDHSFLHLPLLESTTPPQYLPNHDQTVTDWRVFDKLVASQLSHVDASKDSDFCNNSSRQDFRVSHDKQTIVPECASTSTSSEHIDVWN